MRGLIKSVSRGWVNTADWAPNLAVARGKPDKIYVMCVVVVILCYLLLVSCVLLADLHKYYHIWYKIEVVHSGWSRLWTRCSSFFRLTIVHYISLSGFIAQEHPIDKHMHFRDFSIILLGNRNSTFIIHIDSFSFATYRVIDKLDTNM